MTYTGCPEFERDRFDSPICLREDGNVDDELVVFAISCVGTLIQIPVYLLNNLFPVVCLDLTRERERG